MNTVGKIPTQPGQVVAACKIPICLRNSTIWFQLEIRTPASFVLFPFSGEHLEDRISHNNSKEISGQRYAESSRNSSAKLNTSPI